MKEERCLHMGFYGEKCLQVSVCDYHISLMTKKNLTKHTDIFLLMWRVCTGIIAGSQEVNGIQ
jgi:hypothetical protein